MMLSFTEPFTEKLHKQLVKTWKKRKNHVSNFSTRSIDDMKTKKKPNLFCWYKDTLQQPSTTVFTQQGQKPVTSLKKDSKENPLQVFFCKISNIFENTFSYRTPPAVAFDI